jgi:hypothetical protein
MPSFVPMLRRLTHAVFPLPQVREVAYHPQRSTVYCCSSAWRALTFERDFHHQHFEGLEGSFVQAKVGDDLHVGMRRSRDPSARFKLEGF